MLDINTLITAIVASSLTTGILGFAFKTYIKRLMDNHFDRISRRDELSIQQMEKIQSAFLDKRIGIYPEIVELVHRLKNTLQHGKTTANAFEWDTDLAEMCGLLTERLYTWRYFLPKDLFEKLHDFKQICQDILVIIDYSTRKENITRSEQYLENIQKRYPKIEEAIALHDEIQDMLSSNVSQLGNIT